MHAPDEEVAMSTFPPTRWPEPHGFTMGTPLDRRPKRSPLAMYAPPPAASACPNRPPPPPRPLSRPQPPAA